MDDVMPIIFCMIFVQAVAMWNNAKKIESIENTIALEIRQQDIDSRRLAAFELDVKTALSAQVERSLAAKKERSEQYDELIRHMDQRSVDRITRSEVEEWRNEVQAVLPFLPPIPKINSPQNRVPLLP
jgi:hypothetical protein